MEKLIDHQAAAQHPGSEVAARGLLDAAGIPSPSWRMVVRPDDPALGEFRKDFAGDVGYFGEYPSGVSATNPGFRGITHVLHPRRPQQGRQHLPRGRRLHVLSDGSRAGKDG